MVRHVLVTGASTGIGAATVEHLAGPGWTVHAGVRKLADGARLVESHGDGVRPLLLDVTEPDQIAAAVEQLRSDSPGGLDGVVNNAGIVAAGPVELLRDDEWRSVFDVNVFGAVAVTRATLPLVRRARGRFVFVGSISGRTSAPTLAAYSSSKHAIEAICESLRHELAPQGIKVVLLEPGAVVTPIWDKADAEVDDLVARFDDETRPLYEWMRPMGERMIADGREHGVAASEVAELVERALTAVRPRARYVIGTQAKAGAAISRFAPDWLRDRLLGAATGAPRR
ncbi:MAG: SDR family oxidoreductase [Actinomycetota bacterium]